MLESEAGPREFYGLCRPSLVLAEGRDDENEDHDNDEDVRGIQDEDMGV